MRAILSLDGRVENLCAVSIRYFYIGISSRGLGGSGRCHGGGQPFLRRYRESLVRLL